MNGRNSRGDMSLSRCVGKWVRALLNSYSNDMVQVFERYMPVGMGRLSN